MASVCHTPIGGRTVRVTLLTAAGAVVTGAGASAVTAGWTQVTMTDDVDAPAEWRIRVGATAGCLAVKARPHLNWVDVTIDFCEVDPEILNQLTGATLIDDPFGDSVGWGADTGGYGTTNFALELWTGLAGTGGCATAGQRYGYLLLPWVLGGVHGAVTHERGTVTFVVKAETQLGNQWGAGPYNVVTNGSGVAVPLLAPVPETRHRHWQVTHVGPPVAVCGAQTLTPA